MLSPAAVFVILLIIGIAAGVLFDRFAGMIAEGSFPYPARGADSTAAPRVGDGVMSLDADGRVSYLSPNANSALHRVGIHANAVGMRLAELGFHDTMVREAYEHRVPVVEEEDPVVLESPFHPAGRWARRSGRSFGIGLELEVLVMQAVAELLTFRPQVAHVLDVGRDLDRHRMVDGQKVAIRNHAYTSHAQTSKTGATSPAMMPKMLYPTKTALVIRNDLAAWQKANVAAFLAGGLTHHFPEMGGEPYRDAEKLRAAWGVYEQSAGNRAMEDAPKLFERTPIPTMVLYGPEDNVVMLWKAHPVNRDLAAIEDCLK